MSNPQSDQTMSQSKVSKYLGLSYFQITRQSLATADKSLGTD